MTQRNIDFGSFPDDPDADAIRSAFQKTQENFTELFNGIIGSTVYSINKTSGAGITVNAPTGNVVISANIACVQVHTSTLSIGRGANGSQDTSITQSSQTLWVDLPDTIQNVSNIILGGYASVTGNITGGNLISLGDTLTTGNVVANNVVSNSTISTSGNVYTGNIYATGDVYATGDIITSYSDVRLKTKIGSIKNAVEKMCAIETMYYTSNEVATGLGVTDIKPKVGVTAQSVLTVAPEVVHPSGLDSKYWTVQYERLVPYLIECIKEQQAQIEELKSNIVGIGKNHGL